MFIFSNSSDKSLAMSCNFSKLSTSSESNNLFPPFTSPFTYGFKKNSTPVNFLLCNFYARIFLFLFGKIKLVFTIINTITVSICFCLYSVLKNFQFSSKLKLLYRLKKKLKSQLNIYCEHFYIYYLHVTF